MEFLPHWPFVEFLSDWWFWGQLLFWIYGFGLVFNLLLWYAVYYQLSRYQKLTFWDVVELSTTGGIAICWFISWPVIFLMIIRGDQEPKVIMHLFGAALGIPSSLRWSSTEGLFL